MICGFLNATRGLAVVTMLTAAASSAAPKRPNLVFVFSDQKSSDMLGCYGNTDIQTPNLDRLARAGVRFNHCISNSPVCTPYRGILFSGQHPLNQGAIQNDLQMLPGKGTYFAEVLRDAGYRTGYYGKWHLYGGDRERGIPAGACRYGFDHGPASRPQAALPMSRWMGRTAEGKAGGYPQERRRESFCMNQV